MEGVCGGGNNVLKTMCGYKTSASHLVAKSLSIARLGNGHVTDLDQIYGYWIVPGFMIVSHRSA